ncbi:MAG: hypothetical protein ABIN58_03120, partial [candidate division WOR-3 bacterium]
MVLHGGHKGNALAIAKCLKRELLAFKLLLKENAAVFFQQGRWPQALSLLQAACAQATNDLEVRLKLGTCYLIASKPKEAWQEALFVLSHQPTNDEALILLADAALAPQPTEETVKRLESLRARSGQRPGYHVAWGTL